MNNPCQLLNDTTSVIRVLEVPRLRRPSASEIQSDPEQHGVVMLGGCMLLVQHAAALAVGPRSRHPSTAVPRPQPPGTYRGGCLCHRGTHRSGLVQREGLCVGAFLRWHEPYGWSEARSRLSSSVAALARSLALLRS